MNKIAALAAISASALAMSVSASFADYTLNILHINDWHSRIESNNKFESTCSAEDEGKGCLLYTSPSPRDGLLSRMPSSA